MRTDAALTRTDTAVTPTDVAVTPTDVPSARTGAVGDVGSTQQAIQCTEILDTLSIAKMSKSTGDKEMEKQGEQQMYFST